MKQVWRLCRAKYATDPLNGEGASRFGGRWNKKGTKLVYCAESLALACLETLVHCDLRELPKDYFAICIEIVDGVAMKNLSMDELPAGWRNIPGPDSLKDLGSAWASGMTETVLIVPSAVVPFESNYLINPEHPNACKLSVTRKIPFPFDPRLHT